MKELKVPVGVSVRHIHLSQEDKEKLFGKGYTLTPRNSISQSGEYACQEEVEVIGPRGRSLPLRVIGPETYTQVELSLTDAIYLGMDPPLRESGDLAGTPGIQIKGPNGEVWLPQGVILAWRHLHTPPDIARKLGLKNKQCVKVRLGQKRSLIFENVLIRISENFTWEFHIDTDEANAARVKTGDMAFVVLED
ncbi:MAG: phosphate propanoyltransferase [Spirochaetales bacterium]